MEKKPGEYTVDDYYSWPEGERIELIDGVIYDMAAPTDVHQLITLEMGSVFREYIRQKNGKCIPVVSPIDVQLDEDDKTMVQPDIIIVCDRSKFKNGRIFGAPDLVVEVLSPSTRKNDLFLKLGKYANAGVREYWIINPVKKRVIVYNLMNEEEDAATIYTFAGKVPVKIFDGNCEVDFAEIYDYIRFLYEDER